MEKVEFLMGDDSALKMDEEEFLLPNVEDKTHILEPGPFLWDVRLKLPETLPPTFRSETARIDYAFTVKLLRKAQSALELKTFLPITVDFPKDTNFKELVEIVKAVDLPSSGLSRIFSSNSSQKLFIVLDSPVYQYCPFGMKNPCVSVHLALSSHANDTITEIQSIFRRKLVMHHADKDVTLSMNLNTSTITLIPPLAPQSSQEYYLQIPILPEEATDNFVNPSKFSARCIFNEYYVTLTVRGVSVKFCISISTYKPDAVRPIAQPETNALETSQSNNEPPVKKEKQNTQTDEEQLTLDAVNGWSCEKVASWLTEHGLEKFCESFIEQEVDGRSLLLLEEQYFSSVGVKLIGDVVKLKNGLNALKEKLGN